MDSRTFWISAAVLLTVCIVGMAGYFIFFSEAPRKIVMSGTEAEEIQKFTDECMADLARRNALRYGNTAEQLASTCKCFGTDIYPVYKEMTHAEAAEFGKQPEGRKRVKTIFQKCINKIGLDGSEEWFVQQ